MSEVTKLKESEDPSDVAALLDKRLKVGVVEAREWAKENLRAWEYYQSHQWGDKIRDDEDTIPIVANVVRRDLDQMRDRVLDAEPIVNPKGRYGKHYEFGQRLVDITKWTRDEEEDWQNNLEDAITDCFNGGEGILEEIFNQSAAGGLGMPEARWVDPRTIVWDPSARDWQKDDADWVIRYLPRKVDYLEEKWKHKLNGKKVEPDVPHYFFAESPPQQYKEAGADRVSGRSSGTTLSFLDIEPQAYEKTMFEKKIFFDKIYIERESGRVATTKDEETGELSPMTPEDYDRLSDTKKKEIIEDQVEREELWRTIVVNQTVVDRGLSVYDKSRGGHGKYPYAFFVYVRVRDRSHGKGEIDYLVGLQDLINRSLSRWLEQLMIAGANFVVSPKGALPQEDEEKLLTIGEQNLQVFHPYPGFEGPRFEGAKASGAQIFQAGYQLLSQIKDQVSGVYQTSRGDMPYQTSGKGIKALQAQTDLLGTSPRRHIESGLQRATHLRISNIIQFMRGNRIAEVLDGGSKDTKPIYVGQDILEIMSTNKLMPATNPKTGKTLTGSDGKPLGLIDPKTGKEVDVLVFGDGETDNVDLKRITYELDTGKERNREERAEFAGNMLQMLGPPAARYALELMDAPNREILLEDLENGNATQRLLAQVEEISENTGLEVPEILEMLMQQVASAIQTMKAPQGPQSPAGGPPAPGGPPTIPQAPPAPQGAPTGPQQPPGPPQGA